MIRDYEGQNETENGGMQSIVGDIGRAERGAGRSVAENGLFAGIK